MKDPASTFIHLGHGSLFGVQRERRQRRGSVLRQRRHRQRDTARSRCRASRSRDSTRSTCRCATSGSTRWRSSERRSAATSRRRSARSSTSSVTTGFSKIDNRIPPESDLIIALYYVGMQNYGYKGAGVSDKDTTQADGDAAERRVAVRAGRHHAGTTQNQDVQRFTGSFDGDLASVRMDAERRHGGRRPRRASISSRSAA